MRVKIAGAAKICLLHGFGEIILLELNVAIFFYTVLI